MEEDLMAIVDVSVINEGDNARRFPSGLLVKRLEQGKSKVIWIERAEYHSNTIGESPLKTLMQGAPGGFSGYKFLCMLKHRGASFPEGHIHDPAGHIFLLLCFYSPLLYIEILIKYNFFDFAQISHLWQRGWSKAFVEWSLTFRGELGMLSSPKKISAS